MRFIIGVLAALMLWSASAQAETLSDGDKAAFRDVITG